MHVIVRAKTFYTTEVYWVMRQGVIASTRHHERRICSRGIYWYLKALGDRRQHFSVALVSLPFEALSKGSLDQKASLGAHRSVQPEQVTARKCAVFVGARRRKEQDLSAENERG